MWLNTSCSVSRVNLSKMKVWLDRRIKYKGLWIKLVESGFAILVLLEPTKTAEHTLTMPIIVSQSTKQDRRVAERWI